LSFDDDDYDDYDDDDDDDSAATVKRERSSAASSSKVAAAETEAAKQERKQRRAQHKAYAFIITTLRPKQLQLVRHVYRGNAFELWRVLREAYSEVRTAETVSMLLFQLTTIAKLDTESISEYIMRVQNIGNMVDAQREKGENPLEERMMKQFIINGLMKNRKWIESAKNYLRQQNFGEWTRKRCV
jgi:hypothetical protein